MVLARVSFSAAFFAFFFLSHEENSTRFLFQFVFYSFAVSCLRENRFVIKITTSMLITMKTKQF